MYKNIFIISTILNLTCTVIFKNMYMYQNILNFLLIKLKDIFILICKISFELLYNHFNYLNSFQPLRMMI